MDEKWAAYRDAVIGLEAPSGVVWVRPAPVTWTLGTYPDPEGRVICVITAHNPGGQIVSEVENAERQEQLEEKLKGRGWTVWRAAGGDPSWEHVEASAAVVGVEESEVVTLGAEFGQDAIFVLTPAGRHVVGCLSVRELSTGWSISAERPDKATKTMALERCAAPPVTSATTVETEDEDEDIENEDIEEEEDEGLYESISICEENFLTGERAAGFADEDEYLDWISRREGLLCVIKSGASTIELRGDGQGRVLARGAAEGPESPLPMADALRRLAGAGMFAAGADFESAGWDAGDVATIVLPYAGYDECRIDGEEWIGGSIPYPRSPQDGGSHVLVIEHWELTMNGGPIFPGRDSGWAVLARIGPLYAAIEVFDGETECKKIDARTDQAAVAAFIANYTALESTPDRYRHISPAPETDRPTDMYA